MLALKFLLHPGADESSADEGFCHSVTALASDVRQCGIIIEQSRGLDAPSLSRVFELTALLAATSIPAAVYKILALWVQLKNGRKIRLKLSGMEIEVTQLSEREFLRLLTILAEHEGERDSRALRAVLQDSGYALIGSKEGGPR